MQLKEELTLIQRGNRSIPNYLHAIKALADEIAIIDHPISDDDLTLYVLNGLGPDFREIAAPIRARETSLAFEELHDLLVGHESYLRRLEAATQQLVASANYTHRAKQGDSAKKFSKSSGQHRSNSSASSQNNVQHDGRRSYHGSGRPNNSNRRYQPKCQICDQLGHIAKSCPQLHSNGVTVNCAQTSTSKDKNWLLDSTASHNITSDLANLSVHSEYDGTDEVILGDGSGQLENPPNPHPPQTQNLSVPPQRVHQMTTRSMNKIFKPKQVNSVSKHPLPQTIEPTSVSQAISQPQWREAMSIELTALMKHGTWDLVSPPSNCNPVGCKWVFRVKRKADGSVDRFKAWLVAKGYNQRPGLDYKETFSPVVKPATIRAIMTIAVMNGWELRQMDVNNAFLNGELIETVYMMQPSGFKDLSKPTHVCRLRKAIYGLKQAPLAWYTALKNAILQLGFHNSKADSSLFIYSQDADWAGNVDDRTSTSAYISFLGSTPISWSSKKQRAVVRSSTEAEYRALANAASETTWLQNFLKELGFPLKTAPQLLCDNLGATHLNFNPVNHSRMKHIQIDLHFVRDLVQQGCLQVCHVHTQDQLADLLTKPLSRQRTQLLSNKIGLADGNPILRGRIKEDCVDQVNSKTEHI
uniref:CCHC-type domain-containing protein n=1 Tax=Fagus sylvatica TaxID=28930 RepID=A0A2N9J3U8_FAGSY